MSSANFADSHLQAKPQRCGVSCSKSQFLAHSTIHFPLLT